MNLTILPDKTGILHIVTGWQQNYYTPTQSRTGWTTGLQASEYPELIGRTAQEFGTSVYRVVLASGLIRFVETIGGAQAKNTYYEEKPIKRPKWAKSWRDGKWSRY